MIKFLQVFFQFSVILTLVALGKGVSGKERVLRDRVTASADLYSCVNVSKNGKNTDTFVLTKKRRRGSCVWVSWGSDAVQITFWQKSHQRSDQQSTYSVTFKQLNKFVRTKMRPKGGTKIFLEFLQKILIFFKSFFNG